ncbi:MAG: tetratricopeptide repeat protein [Chloracidobacterium sp.]|nr:tetratricopeptide repeat protein [Chloracidobacterium sp.]MCO5334103.1 tetratricopeptide repeat protein [Pyrinomonadaceae bacterium]
MTRFFRSRSVAVFALLLFAAVPYAFGQTKQEQRQARQYIDQADKAFYARDFASAADLYEQAIKIIPSDPVPHFWRANALHNLKRLDEAEQEFQLALSQGYKPIIQVYQSRWYLYVDQKKYDKALDDIKKGLEIDPTNSILLHGLGDVAFQSANYAEALDGYQKALAVTPKDGDLYYSIALTHSRMGDLGGQANAAAESIRLGTRYMGDAYYLLGDAEDRMNKVANAVESYRRALAAKKELYQVYVRLAALLQKQNKLTEAIDTIKKGMVVFPRDGRLYTDISWYYSLADRPTDARDAAKAATILLPNEYMGFTNLCRALNDTKQYPEAVVACNSALRLNPGDGETYFYLGRANDMLGRKREATGNYAKAVTGMVAFTKANPDYPDGFYILGNAYYSNGQRERAIDAYLKCIELNPNFSRARFNLGYIYLLKGDKASANEQYNRLLATDAALAAKLRAEIDK